LPAEYCGHLVSRQDSLVWRAIHEADAALKALAKGPNGFQHYRLGEVPR
jgi:hypothetical protein